jgi:hypothetical protein
MDPQPMLDAQSMQIVTLLLGHMSTSAIVVWLIQWAKKCPWISWVTQDTPGRARAIAIVLAGIKTVGIQFTWNPDSRQAVFVIPTLAVAGGIALHWFSSFVLQEWMYHVARAATNGKAAAPAK